MVHLVERLEEKKEKRHRITFPSFAGRVGFSFEFGRKQLFIGLAVADVETETIVRKRKLKVLKNKSKSSFIEF